mmetsp:Transcript_122396/g.391621  ORF Transcript_122396/g.391621 Transcript_122396/m.391621 type:complete len:231 (+) Transcript_122396:314-1006(+)
MTLWPLFVYFLSFSSVSSESSNINFVVLWRLPSLLRASSCQASLPARLASFSASTSLRNCLKMSLLSLPFFPMFFKSLCDLFLCNFGGAAACSWFDRGDSAGDVAPSCPGPFDPRFPKGTPRCVLVRAASSFLLSSGPAHSVTTLADSRRSAISVALTWSAIEPLLPYATGGSETEPPPAPDGYAALLLAPPGDSAAGGAETALSTCKRRARATTGWRGSSLPNRVEASS